MTYITAWRLSFSDEMRIRGVLYMRCTIQIDVFTFFTFMGGSVALNSAEVGAYMPKARGVKSWGRILRVCSTEGTGGGDRGMTGTHTYTQCIHYMMMINSLPLQNER